MSFDWAGLENAFVSKAQREVLRIMRENRGDTFYAVALQESYRELDGQICLPCLALQSVEALMKQQGAAAPYELGSANWKWNLLALRSPKLTSLQKNLNAEAERSTQAHWQRTEKRFMATMVRVCKRLYADLKKHPQTTADFFVFFDDEEGDAELAKRCLPSTLYAKHFHRAEAKGGNGVQKKLGKGDVPARKVETYLQDLDSYEEEIVALADGALTALIEKLDTDDGWRAARLLGRIGRSTPAVLKALRQQVQEAREPAAWCARVLESLGDTEYLFRLASQQASQKAALSGLVFTYTSWASSLGWPNRRELDYRPLQRILESKRPAWTRVVEEQLRPGSSFVTIHANEVDEAIRGLQSPHVLIRQHATCILGSRELGVAAGKKILPALVERLDDPHPNVRRLAVLNLSYWKAAAKPYFPNIRRLLKDPHPDVRAGARSVIR